MVDRKELYIAILEKYGEVNPFLLEEAMASVELSRGNDDGQTFSVESEDNGKS